MNLHQTLLFFDAVLTDIEQQIHEDQVGMQRRAELIIRRQQVARAMQIYLAHILRNNHPKLSQVSMILDHDSIPPLVEANEPNATDQVYNLTDADVKPISSKIYVDDARLFNEPMHVQSDESPDCCQIA